MKLTTKGRYAVRAMLDLAMQENASLVLLKDIAERQEIPQRYLEQVMVALKTSGLVNSVRGACGGYALARQPADINLIDILRVSIGDICLVDCAKDPAVCSRSATCAARDIWVEVGAAIDGLLGAISLQDLVERQRNKSSNGSDMYFI